MSSIDQALCADVFVKPQALADTSNIGACGVPGMAEAAFLRGVLDLVCCGVRSCRAEQSHLADDLVQDMVHVLLCLVHARHSAGFRLGL